MTTTNRPTSMPTGRFAVSESGMRELNGGRQPWDLVKELVQNSWDEAPFAIECRVTVQTQVDGDTTMVTVQDDGSGFSDVADAYTLMGHTKKRLSPTKRGRFNVGEKDVISVAIEAEVETVGHTVTFPPQGSRTEATNSRTKGTVVRVLMPWNEEQSGELVAMLQRFRPPKNCHLFVNDTEVPRQPATAVRSATLPTVVQDDLGKPMRATQRQTEIHMTEPRDSSGEAWLYEMGIPVRVLDCPWDIDVMQKLPMGQQRDAVSEAYLNRIYAEVLNSTHGKLKREEFGKQWVKRAIEHSQIKPGAVKATMKGRYGRAKAVLETLDSDANLRASEAGYEVVPPGALSQKEKEALRKHASLRAADEVFPTPPPPRTDYDPEPDSNQARFAEWVTEMADQCGLTANVKYFSEPANARLADCSASTANPTLRFNEARLGETFFKPPYGSAEHWRLLFHELGHAMSDSSAMGHGERWGEGVSRVAALIAVNIARSKAD